MEDGFVRSVLLPKYDYNLPYTIYCVGKVRVILWKQKVFYFQSMSLTFPTLYCVGKVRVILWK